MCRTIRKQHKDEFSINARRLHEKWLKMPSTYSTKNFENYPEAYYLEDIKPVFYGCCVKLEILPALKNANLPGLAEAIEFATVKLEFSSSELRRCNLKNNYLIKLDHRYDSLFDEHNLLKKGALWLRCFNYSDVKDYEKLSDDAKKWFFTFEEKVGLRKYLHISSNIPRGYCREVVEPLYITKKMILNSDYIKEAAFYNDMFNNVGFSTKVDHTLSHAQYKYTKLGYGRQPSDLTRTRKRIFETEYQDAIDEVFDKTDIL